MVRNERKNVDRDELGTTWSTERGVLRITVRGRAPSPVVQEVVELLGTRVAAADEDRPLLALVDLRDAAFSPSGQEIRLGAKQLDALGSDGRIAMIVSSDFQYGLVRMLGLLASESGLDVQPFRDPDEAAHWLRE